MRLMVRPRPFADESLAGFFKRVTDVNGGVPGGERTLLAGEHDGGPHLAGIRRWMKEHGHPRAALFGMTLGHMEKMGGHALYGPHVSAEHVRFCPECLSEASYWRAAWEHLLIQHCPRHRVWLTGTCHECSQVIPARRERMLKCSCGANLIASPPHRLLSDKTYAEAIGAWVGVAHGYFLPLGKR